jgi:hypothetical protein
MKKLFLACAFSLASLSTNALVLTGTEEMDLYGREAFITVVDSATLTTHTGADVSFLVGRENSTINVNGGEISWLRLYDNTTANISFVDDLSWLLVSDNAAVNIYGSNFNYFNGHLSGIWGNGAAFSFWALEELDLSSGNIGNLLPDNIVLHNAVSVPESSGLILFFIGLLALISRRRSNKVIESRSGV